MAMIFRNELALMLGVLASKYLGGKIFGYGDNWPRPPVIFTNNPGGYDRHNDRKIPTGRGGYYEDYNGDTGRPGAETIEAYDESDRGMAGTGGKLFEGGTGLANGRFGTITNPLNSDITTISAAGGSGWYGGGFSLLRAGGGGGSSFVLSTQGWELLSGEDQTKIFQNFLNTLTPEQYQEYLDGELTVSDILEMFLGSWYDYSYRMMIDTILYGLNTDKPDIIDHYPQGFKEYRQRLANNGGCLISEEGKHIILEDGQLKNVGQAYYYTGLTQTFTVPTTGKYHIICYGACGGDRIAQLTFNINEHADLYWGGFGGCASGIFDLEQDETLTVKVGAQGVQYTDTIYYNGFRGRGGCTGGGSETCIVRNKINHFADDAYARIITAGGGGGIYASQGDNPNYRPTTDETVIVNKNNYDDDSETDGDGECTEIEEIEVSDKHRLHVLIHGYSQVSIPNGSKITVQTTLFDTEEILVVETRNQQSGEWTIDFSTDLDRYYPEDTPIHTVKFSVQMPVATAIYQLAEKKPIIVWTELIGDRLGKTGLEIAAGPVVLQIDDVAVEDFIELEFNSKRNYEIEVIEDVSVEDFIDWIIEHKGEITKEIIEEFGVEDFVEYIKTHLDYINEVIIEDMSLDEIFEYVNKHKGEFDELNVEAVGCEDIVELVKYTLTYKNKDIIEDADCEDIVILENHPPVLITTEVDQVDNHGTVDPSQSVIYEKSASFRGYPDNGYRTKWYNGQELLIEDNIITIVALEPTTLTAHFVMQSLPTPPYINEGLVVCFDAIDNEIYDHSNTIKVWKNMLEIPTTFNLDYRDFISDELEDVYDAIDNTHNGHDDDALIWHDILDTDPTIITNTYGYVSTNLEDSYDAIDHGTGPDWENLI